MENDLDRLSQRLVWLITISIIFLLLAACASPQPALVAVREQPPSRKLQSHRVSHGETLYSIAWRYGLDHRRLAAANGISPPYTIYPDQTLRLAEAELSHAPSRPHEAAERSTEMRKTPSAKLEDQQPNLNNRSKNQTVASGVPAAPILLQEPLNWRWPAGGRILSAFGSSTGLNKGVDIEGKLGESVIAAASGQVVYAGSGLRGYGKLLIIKHNDTYLSAYAHNNRLLLSEGETVKGGDKIAEMGSSGTDAVKLHFEIRRQGKPVDPIRYLPKR